MKLESLLKPSIAEVTKSSLISPDQPLHSPHLPLPVSQSVPSHNLLVILQHTPYLLLLTFVVLFIQFLPLKCFSTQARKKPPPSGFQGFLDQHLSFNFPDNYTMICLCIGPLSVISQESTTELNLTYILIIYPSAGPMVNMQSMA